MAIRLLFFLNGAKTKGADRDFEHAFFALSRFDGQFWIGIY